MVVARQSELASDSVNILTSEQMPVLFLENFIALQSAPYASESVWAWHGIQTLYVALASPLQHVRKLPTHLWFDVQRRGMRTQRGLELGSAL